jgi:hypothetical protein
MQITRFVLLSLLLSLLQLPVAFGQIGAAEEDAAPNYDLRIRKQLEEADYKFDITSSGRFKLVFNLDGRTQLVFVNSVTYEYQGMEIREISSPAMRLDADEDPSAEIANFLLGENSRKKLGAWQLDTYNDGKLINFAVRVSAESSTEALVTFMQLCAYMGDGFEEEYSEEDTF